jgi:hypothetical protein
MSEVIVGPETIPTQITDLLNSGTRIYCTTIIPLPDCHPLRAYEPAYVEIAEQCAYEYPGVPVVDYAGLLQLLDICIPERLIVVAPSNDTKYIRAACHETPAYLSLVTIPFTATSLKPDMEIETDLCCSLLVRRP